jgi:FKBP-type peptidyl-prolyl cis-trans isomerase (trigger factor)
MPVIDTKDYKGFEVELPQMDVRDQDIDYEIKILKTHTRNL